MTCTKCKDKGYTTKPIFPNGFEKIRCECQPKLKLPETVAGKRLLSYAILGAMWNERNKK